MPSCRVRQTGHLRVPRSNWAVSVFRARLDRLKIFFSTSRQMGSWKVSGRGWSWTNSTFGSWATVSIQLKPAWSLGVILSENFRKNYPNCLIFRILILQRFEMSPNWHIKPQIALDKFLAVSKSRERKKSFEWWSFSFNVYFSKDYFKETFRRIMDS